MLQHCSITMSQLVTALKRVTSIPLKAGYWPEDQGALSSKTNPDTPDPALKKLRQVADLQRAA
jgi:hypothetical protein